MAGLSWSIHVSFRLYSSAQRLTQKYTRNYTHDASNKVIQLKRKILWAYTCYGPHRIKIWKSFVNAQYDGLTWNRKQGYAIEINSEVFEQPALLDETLIHEFVHVVEYFHGLQWKSMCKTRDAECCQAVRAIGHGLAQMLRELVQV